MPKCPRFPYLIDEEEYMSTQNLNKWGYFKVNTKKWGTITWSTNGIKTGSISIESHIKENELSTIRLIYTCNQIDFNYTVALEWLPSNIGNGKIWYFICPLTHRRCRKLHLMKGRFYAPF